MRKDFIGIFAPTAYFLTGVTSFIVSSCVSGPDPEGVTGPSGSDLVCMFYFVFAGLLWIPLGMVLMVVQYLRFRTSHKGPFYDSQRHLVGVVLGLLLLGLSFLVLDDKGGFMTIAALSLVANLVPGALSFLLGYAVSQNRRNEARLEINGGQSG